MKIETGKRNKGGIPIEVTIVLLVIVIALWGLTNNIIKTNRTEKLQAEKSALVCATNRLYIQNVKLKLAVREGKALTNSVSEQEVFGALGLKPLCPDGGTYAIGDRVEDRVSCSIHTLINK